MQLHGLTSAWLSSNAYGFVITTSPTSAQASRTMHQLEHESTPLTKRAQNSPAQRASVSVSVCAVLAQMWPSSERPTCDANLQTAAVTRVCACRTHAFGASESRSLGEQTERGYKLCEWKRAAHSALVRFARRNGGLCNALRYKVDVRQRRA